MSTLVMFLHALFVGIAAANKMQRVVFVNNNLIDGEKSLVWSFDLASRRVTRLPASLSSSFDFVSGAAICGDSYYAIHAEIETGTVGLTFVANFSTSAAVQYLAVPSLLHAVWCDPQQPGRLLVVRSDPGTPEAIFYVARYDPSTQTSNDVAQIPTTWNWAEDDAVFAFDVSANRVWASGPVTSGVFENSGAVFAVDVSANGTSTAFTLGYEAGWLGFLFPTSSSTGFGYRQLDQNYDLRWATFTLEAGKVTCTDGSTVSTTLWAGGSPLAACDDVVVAASLPSNNLTLADARTGKTIWSASLESLGVKAPNAGALAAVCA